MSATAETFKIITNESPLVIPPILAARIGLAEATILQQLHYWMQKSTNVVDGVCWVYNTYLQWHEQFPFLSSRTIRRAITNLEALNLIRSERIEAKHWNQRKWYTICYDSLKAFISPMCPDWPHGSGQSGHIDPANLDASYTKTSTKEISKEQKHKRPTTHPVTELIGVKVDALTEPIGLCEESKPILIEAEKAILLEEVKAEIAPQVLHPKLKELVLNYEATAIQQALEVVREAKQTSKNIKNPTGLLRFALEKSWKPNQIHENGRSLPDDFSQWFDAAKAAGVVIASQLVNGKLLVYDAQAQSFPYEQMALLHPLEVLTGGRGLTVDKEPLLRPLGVEDPFDFSDILAIIDTQFSRLKWSAERVREFLVQAYGKHTRALLADAELLDLQARLQVL